GEHGSRILPAFGAYSPASATAELAMMARSSRGKWHAATCPSWWGVSSGSASEQSGSCARGHRGWNRHPDGGLIGDGTSPSRMIRFFWAAMSGSGMGTADIRAPVYGCLGFRYSVSPDASSTILPRYITATRSDTCLTTERSWAMNR